MRSLSKRESRLVAVLILIAVLMIADLAIVQPLIDGFSNRAQARSALIARYGANERLIAAVPRLVREAQRRDAALGRYVLAAGDAGIASDTLRQRIQAATSAVGGDFRGSEDVQAVAGVVVTRASLRLKAGQLGKLLATLENDRPLITVNALSVGADDALVTGRATDLDVQIDFAMAYHAPHAR